MVRAACFRSIRRLQCFSRSLELLSRLHCIWSTQTIACMTHILWTIVQNTYLNLDFRYRRWNPTAGSKWTIINKRISCWWSSSSESNNRILWSARPCTEYKSAIVGRSSYIAYCTLLSRKGIICQQTSMGHRLWHSTYRYIADEVIIPMKMENGAL